MLETGVNIVPGLPEGTIESATHIQTPSQAEHGLEGRFALQPQVQSSRKSSSRHEAPASLACSRPKGSSYDNHKENAL